MTGVTRTSDLNSCRPRCSGIALAVVFMMAGHGARAQDFAEFEAPPAAAAAQNNVFVLNDSFFNQWVFGNFQGDISAQDQLDAVLKLHIADLERSCVLSDEQKRKLRLAGHGDIKRFCDRLADAHKVFDRLKNDQNNINEIFQYTQPLAETYKAGLFNADSVFFKSIGPTLNPEQAARYSEALREKQRFRYKSKVLITLSNIDGMVGFSSAQSRRLIEIILRETTPPEKPDAQYDNVVMLLKIARIESKIRPVFDETQWKAFNEQLQQGRAMDQFLQDNGYIERVEPARPGLATPMIPANPIPKP